MKDNVHHDHDKARARLLNTIRQRRWRKRHPSMRRIIKRRLAKKAERENLGVARGRQLLIRLKRKFGMPYRLPLQLQKMTPEQIVKEWRGFI